MSMYIPLQTSFNVRLEDLAKKSSNELTNTNRILSSLR
jgi:hypothetical protein